MGTRAKKLSLKELYQAIYEKGQASKPELAQDFGVSLTAVSDYVNQLESLGFVESKAKGTSTGGRKPLLYQVTPGFRYIVGVDMRVTHFYVFLSDVTGNLLPTELIHVNKDYYTYVTALAQNIQYILARFGLDKKKEQVIAVGICISGVTDFEHKVVDLSNELGWLDRPLALDLEKALGIPVFVENDARVYARNEINMEETNNVVTVLYLSRGVGLALVIGDRVLQGYNNRAGDSQFFGRDIDKIYHVIRTCGLFQEINDLPYIKLGAQPQHIFDLNQKFMRHVEENPDIKDAVEVFSTEVARMMIAMANVVNPKRILLTGNVFDYFDFIYHQVKSKILALPVCHTPEVGRNSPTDNPLERGIVRLVMEKFFSLEQFTI